jgi:hypothetical protein
MKDTAVRRRDGRQRRQMLPGAEAAEKELMDKQRQMIKVIFVKGKILEMKTLSLTEIIPKSEDTPNMCCGSIYMLS